MSRIKDKGSAGSVVPLLRHPEPRVRNAAVEYLERAGDRSAVGPLCDAMEAIRDRQYRSLIAGALGKLGDPAALPALERALRDGVDGDVGFALGKVGNEATAQMLAERIDRLGSVEAAGGLMLLVARSNLPLEKWMWERSSTPETGFNDPG